MKKKTVMIMCALFTMLTSIVSCSGKAQRSADTIPADTLQASLIIEDSTPLNDAVGKLSDSISHVKINPTDKQDTDGLIYWTSDKVCNTNPELVLLLDTLYRYTRSENGKFFEIESVNVKETLNRMKAYRKQLCDYYDRRKLGSDTITGYAKADTVLNHAERLWDIDKNESTMGMIIYNSTYYSWIIFKQYNSLIELLDLCENDKQKSLLIEEWEAWKEFMYCCIGFWSDCTTLTYRGSSGGGPHRGEGRILIYETHINLTKKDIDWFNWDRIDRDRRDRLNFELIYEVPLQSAKTLFLDCCKTRYLNIKDIIKDIIKDMDTQDEDETDYYKRDYEDALKKYKKLPILMDKWIEARGRWSDDVSTDYYHNYYNRLSSGVLLGLARVFSSLD